MKCLDKVLFCSLWRSTVSELIHCSDLIRLPVEYVIIAYFSVEGMSVGQLQKPKQLCYPNYAEAWNEEHFGEMPAIAASFALRLRFKCRGFISRQITGYFCVFWTDRRWWWRRWRRRWWWWCLRRKWKSWWWSRVKFRWNLWNFDVCLQEICEIIQSPQLQRYALAIVDCRCPIL